MTESWTIMLREVNFLSVYIWEILLSARVYSASQRHIISLKCHSQIVGMFMAYKVIFFFKKVNTFTSAVHMHCVQLIQRLVQENGTQNTHC